MDVPRSVLYSYTSSKCRVGFPRRNKKKLEQETEILKMTFSENRLQTFKVFYSIYLASFIYVLGATRYAIFKFDELQNW